MRFPVFRALGASVAYFVAHFMTLIKILWLPTLLLIAVQVYLTPAVLDAQALLMTGQQGGDPMQGFEAMGPMMGYLGLLYLALAIIYPMMIAGVLRHVVRGESPSLPFYLRFAGDELRILMAIILLIIIFSLLGLVGMLAIAALGMALAAASPGLGAISGLVLFLAFLCGLLWFMVRLSVVFAAAVDARSIGLAEAWRVTKGNFWGLFFFWSLWLLLVFAIAIIYLAVAMSDYFAVMMEMIVAANDDAATFEIERRMLEMQRDMWNMSHPGFWGFIIGTYLYMIFHAALTFVPAGVAYRYLTGAQRGE